MKKILINSLINKGYRVDEKEGICFIPFFVEEKDLPEEMVSLRNNHKFMIQTEIV